ncbi:uncharacterized protein Ecym_7446 [Eremothecium cymbalariae DBVPG|uniref:Uncharacterized protein n=1 Tax=Eremothecium cymbalariae (strain CBS 270.75 / DBVPG 7215 / KCTC 17166 / NRRL Y-17582) TaxID=931890 RepID=G8JWQ1_ERECY|nr:hypothetical protein Ecym_7446 [Eremothecium cymbalariae DBVPG\
MQSLYKLSNQSQFHSTESNGSTGSFLTSAPLELTTVKGYNEFLKTKRATMTSTLFSDDKSTGYVVRDGEVLATITGEARDYLLKLFGSS